MISLRPFRAWRPVPDKAHLVGSRSYVSYTPEQLSEKLAGNPWTFLHVIHPPAISEHHTRAERFEAVRNAFHAFVEEGVLVQDEVPTIHLYEQHARGNVSRGLIAGVSLKDYAEGRIKVHEQTLTARENLFAEYLEATAINAEPVLLCTPEGSAWEALLDPMLNTRPAYDFSTTDRVRHRMWSITDGQLQEALQKAFASIPALYIADGHHRMASSARLAQARGATDEDPAAWCLAFIVPRNHLFIFNFDRAVRSLNGMDEGAFLEALGRIGPLVPQPSPWSAPGVVAVRTASGWHGLHLPPAAPGARPDEALDAARLSELVLAPLLGITDLRTDPGIRFVPGTHGTGELDRLVEDGSVAAAFHLHPVGFADLKAVADTGGTMPPKSTYIEPKLRSGLVVHPL
jgi:uncharacterized protein (DUF1015 family)